MKQILLDITKAIVEDPDSVSVSEKVSGDTVVLELSVAKQDMGRVIGKEAYAQLCARLPQKRTSALSSTLSDEAIS